MDSSRRARRSRIDKRRKDWSIQMDVSAVATDVECLRAFDGVQSGQSIVQFDVCGSDGLIARADVMYRRELHARVEDETPGHGDARGNDGDAVEIRALPVFRPSIGELQRVGELQNALFQTIVNVHRERVRRRRRRPTLQLERIGDVRREDVAVRRVHVDHRTAETKLVWGNERTRTGELLLVDDGPRLSSTVDDLFDVVGIWQCTGRAEAAQTAARYSFEVRVQCQVEK